MQDELEVLIVGPLLNNDIVMAEALSFHGFKCAVARHAAIGRPDPATFPAPIEFFSLDRVIVVSSALDFFRLCRRAKCIVCYSGMVVFLLRYFWFLLPFVRFPPIVNIPSGSDITELSLERTKAGRLYRDLLRRCAFTAIPAYPHAIKALFALKLRRFIFFKYPYLLRLEEDSPAGPGGDKIVFLHVSNLDWGETDNKPGRNSTKGNDRFLRAFSSAVLEGAPIECIILDRGPDRTLAQTMVSELGASAAFRWLDAVKPAELKALFAAADVVVDQFDVGGLGATSLEAMAAGKPVLMHLDRECLSLVYDEHPPILNASTEGQIREVIVSNLDRTALHQLGMRAKKWVFENHGTKHNMSNFIFCMCLVAGIPWPRRSESDG